MQSYGCMSHRSIHYKSMCMLIFYFFCILIVCTQPDSNNISFLLRLICLKMGTNTKFRWKWVPTPVANPSVWYRFGTIPVPVQYSGTKCSSVVFGLNRTQNKHFGICVFTAHGFRSFGILVWVGRVLLALKFGPGTNWFLVLSTSFKCKS